MVNHHTTVFLGRLFWNGLADLSVCILSHSYFCVQDLMTLMRLHRCAFSSRPSLFVFVINTTFHELDRLFSFYMHNMSTCYEAHSELKQKPLLLSHMHEMGVHMAYFFSQCSDETWYACSLARAFTALAHTENGCVYGFFFISQCSNKPYDACSLTRAFTALAHAQNGLTYGIFFQSMLRWALLCVQSCQSLRCSRTCTKWAYTYSVNAQTRLNMHAVLPEPSLLSHKQKMSVFMAYFISQCSNKP